MGKWRKKITLALLSVGFLALIPNVANAQRWGSCNSCSEEPYCCPPCPFIEQYELYVDLLWWKPCVDDLDYAAVQSHSEKKFSYKKICPEWEPGIRVTFIMPCFYCDWGLWASWTYIVSDDSSFVRDVNDILVPPLHTKVAKDIGKDVIDTAKGSWYACYHEWDILFTYDCTGNSMYKCHSFIPFFGVTGLFLDQQFKVEFTEEEPEQGSVRWDGDYWGVGLKLGSEYRYRASRCFTFYANGSGSILAGKMDGKQVSKGWTTSSSSSVSKLESVEDDCCHCVPGFHIGTGVFYDTALCNYDFTLRLGYEFVAWMNIPNHRIFPECEEYGWAHGTSSSTRTFVWHGLVAGIGICF